MPRSDPRTQQGGTDTAGYRITHSAGGHTLSLEAWGYFDSSVAAAFTRQATVACEELLPPVELVLDASDLKPQGDEGQRALRAIMESLAPLALSGATIYVDNILTRMQLTRLAKEYSLDGRLKFENDAPNVPVSGQ
jgi:hypothetical protein